MFASVRGLHPLRRAVPDASVGLPGISMSGPITPARASPHRRFGLLPVRSPLLGESFLLSSPAATKMFQFAAFASRYLRDAGIAPGGLPHSDIPGSKGICPSPGLFAACHVLLRLREPRHPPCALCRSVFSYIRLRLMCFAFLRFDQARNARLLYSFVFSFFSLSRLSSLADPVNKVHTATSPIASIMSLFSFLCSPWQS